MKRDDEAHGGSTSCSCSYLSPSSTTTSSNWPPSFRRRQNVISTFSLGQYSSPSQFQRKRTTSSPRATGDIAGGGSWPSSPSSSFCAPRALFVCSARLQLLHSLLFSVLLLLPIFGCLGNSTASPKSNETVTTIAQLASSPAGRGQFLLLSPTTTTASPSGDLISSSNAPSSSSSSSSVFFNQSISLFDLLATSTPIPTWNNSTAATTDNATTANWTSEKAHFQLFTLNWTHIAAPFGVSLWLLLASFAKILFNLNKRFAEAVPDSALLIVLGLALGWALRLLDVNEEVFTLRANTFFLYLLPPIIFDAGYFMPNRQLFDNLDSVLLFAFVGTIWNTLAIGFSLCWLSQLGIFSVPFSTFQILLFASLISAVDPVAVIAVFEEIHINEFLFINVFGEALFNDGVSVVLYQMFRKFIAIGAAGLDTWDYVAGIGSFAVIALGGILIGLLFALITCIATKMTVRVRILAPVFVFVVPYMSYLTAELFGLSSILAIVACGIVMKQYVKGNLSHDASNSVKYFVKMLAQCSESLIFMFLGLSTVSRGHHLDWPFVAATVGLCLLHRVIGVVVQCGLLNRFRTKKFSFSDQFVLSYGGLRGAIAFGLVVSLDDSLGPKKMFVTTCIVVIFFTVFVQGITIRPLLYWLKVEKHDVEREETMFEKICSRHCDYMMVGIEDIAGLKGRNAIRDTFERFNANVLKPSLMRDEQRKPFDGSAILRAYTKISLLEAQKRSNGRKDRRCAAGIGRRVAPAPSPSSVTSTLSYCQWTMEGKQREESQPTQSRIDSPQESRNGKSDETAPSNNGTAEHSAPPSNAFPIGTNTDSLYAMLSRLLDKKALQEVDVPLQERMDEREGEDDIKDNYIEALCPKAEKQPGSPNYLAPPPPPRGRRRHSLSPSLERKMCCSLSRASVLRSVAVVQHPNSPMEEGKKWEKEEEKVWE